MSPGAGIVAVLFVVAAVAGGCGGVSPVIYRGNAKGVLMTLTLPPKPGVTAVQAELAVHFTPAGDTIWRRARQVRKLELFCIWPLKNGGEMTAIDFRLNSKRLTETIPGDAARARPGAYTCGLHAGTNNSGEGWPWLKYVRGALVAARLSRMHH
jgi:hypothetical protein